MKLLPGTVNTDFINFVHNFFSYYFQLLLSTCTSCWCSYEHTGPGGGGGEGGAEERGLAESAPCQGGLAELTAVAGLWQEGGATDSEPGSVAYRGATFGAGGDGGGLGGGNC